MLQRFAKVLFPFLGLLSIPAPRAHAGLVEMKDFDFAIDVTKLGQDVWVSYNLVDKADDKQLREKSPLYKRVSDAIYPQGLGDSEKYYGLIIRSAFLVKQSRETYVRNEVLFDVRYLETVIGRQGVRKLSSGVFQVPNASFAPGYKIEQSLYATSAELKAAKKIDVALLPFAKNLGEPIALLQDSSDFGTILGSKTSRDGRLMNFYYEVSPGVFLIENVTLSHLYNVPPGLLGGTARLKKDYLKAIEESVPRVQGYRP
jgi:hypothetical protein